MSNVEDLFVEELDKLGCAAKQTGPWGMWTVVKQRTAQETVSFYVVSTAPPVDLAKMLAASLEHELDGAKVVNLRNEVAILRHELMCIVRDPWQMDAVNERIRQAMIP